MFETRGIDMPGGTHYRIEKDEKPALKPCIDCGEEFEPSALTAGKCPDCFSEHLGPAKHFEFRVNKIIKTLTSETADT